LAGRRGRTLSAAMMRSPSFSRSSSSSITTMRPARMYSISGMVLKLHGFSPEEYCWQRDAEAPAVSAIASGSQHKTMSAISQRIRLIPRDPDG
jgi:hypothetical protein